MRKFTLSIQLLAIVLFLAACQGENPLAPASTTEHAEIASKKKKPVPFRATFVSVVTNIIGSSAKCGGTKPSDLPFPPFNTLTDTVNLIQGGSGNATHMGKITISLSSCVNLPSPPDQLGGITFDVELLIIAANGDTLILTGDGPNFNIAGGTGRFTGASGWVAGSYTPVGPQSFDTLLEGEIQY